MASRGGSGRSAACGDAQDTQQLQRIGPSSTGVFP
eukprot:CAMPEP_0174949370 /NCGR_PEP_ID=MMETSP1355-20121228/91390_1 /TAXON_ID=464990 /ORGANISM="Hemiselmis tepida, Strain CCMP443" /LENGTH=34 /DNA_ID= /DNA_START= /DNA_END= /DNA_ORIENTATION=